jgi:hypothetical protein
VRFSDGSVLLAISSAARLDSPLVPEAGQYLWDSPLKVLLSRSLPPRILLIGSVFLLISCLSVLGLLARTGSPWFGTTAALITLTPAVRVCFQNVGVGD